MPRFRDTCSCPGPGSAHHVMQSDDDYLTPQAESRCMVDVVVQGIFMLCQSIEPSTGSRRIGIARHGIVECGPLSGWEIVPLLSGWDCEEGIVLI